jgi:drug/metabolite transporter (DMT)-like permease
MTTHRWPGVPIALASAVLFGASTPFAKLLLGAVDPWLTAGLLYLGAGLGLLAIHLARASTGSWLREGSGAWLDGTGIFSAPSSSLYSSLP